MAEKGGDMTKLRPARPEDVPRIYEIVKAAFGPFCMSGLLEDRFGLVEGKSWYEHKAGGVAEECARDPAHFVVAETDGRVVGFASFASSDEAGMVGNNAVEPAYQGRGIGSALIRRVLEILRDRGHQRFQVATMEHDHPARRIYEKYGFRLERSTRHYARKTPSGHESASADVTDADAARRLDANGFELIATFLSYQMTRPQLQQALDGPIA